nr:phage protease [Sphingomonas panni]
MPAGEIATADGRGPYRVKDVQTVLAASARAGKLVIDENHSTDLASPKGLPAPARGWIVQLQSRATGIWGRVEWTDTGKRMMADRQYAGISPVIKHDSSGTISAILRASLVNAPNLMGLQSLHAQRLVGVPDTNPQATAQLLAKAGAEYQRLMNAAGNPINIAQAIRTVSELRR